MSILAREAHRGRIQQILESIDVTIRPEMQRAIAKTIDQPASASGSFPNPLSQMPLAACATEDAQHGTFRTIDDERPNSPAPGLGIENTAALTHSTISANRTVLPKLGVPAGTINNFLSTSFNYSSIQGLSGKAEKGTIRDSSRALITNESRNNTTFSIFAESEHIGRTADILPSDQCALLRIAISLRHLRFGYNLPIGIFEEATSDDLSVLDALYQNLSRIVQAIDRRVATLMKTASEGFDRHMISPGAGFASTRGPRRFKGQEEWQTGRGKKTYWNANADWGSEMAWSEVDVKQAQPGKNSASSRLRHHYIPCEWNLPALGSPS